jgi:putative transcriptional regulator
MKSVHEETLEELREISNIGTKHLHLRTREYAPVTPIKEYTPQEIKELREQNHFTQLYFGELLGVSIKTIQAWEAGTNKPNGTALRMFQVLEQDPHALDPYILIKA